MLKETSIDPLLVVRAKVGDAAAWDELMRRHRMPLYVFLFQMTRDAEASFDLVQETFISAMRHIGGLQDDSKFASWLFGIAHQKCLQFWRKQNREMAAFEELAQSPMDFDPEDDPRRTLIRREQEADFLKMLEGLPLPHRSVLTLYFIEDFSLQEIAEITGVSVGTVKSRLHYAKKAFKELWEENVL
jgi:RNA polymerase sigma-70 factor, ECF subfamily